MRWESVHVAGAGVRLPGPVTARSAVEAGRYAPGRFAADGLPGRQAGTRPGIRFGGAGRNLAPRAGRTCAVAEITEVPQWLPLDGTRRTEAP